jgi:hypothetical protein
MAGAACCATTSPLMGLRGFNTALPRLGAFFPRAGRSAANRRNLFLDISEK